MFGKQSRQPSMFQSVHLEDLIPKKHLLRRIRQAVDLSFVRPLVAQIHEKGERPRLSFS